MGHSLTPFISSLICLRNRLDSTISRSKGIIPIPSSRLLLLRITIASVFDWVYWVVLPGGNLFHLAIRTAAPRRPFFTPFFYLFHFIIVDMIFGVWCNEYILCNRYQSKKGLLWQNKILNFTVVILRSTSCDSQTNHETNENEMSMGTRFLIGAGAVLPSKS